MRAIILAMTLCLSAGCASYGPEELDRLVKEDPNFRQMLVARDQMRAEIRLIKQGLFERKKVADVQIQKVRQEYEQHAKSENEKILKYQAVIETNRNVLRRDIETSEAQAAAKRAELERLQKTLGEVEKVLSESRDIRLSAEERQKWEERRLMISEKIRPLSDDIAELEIRIRLNKRKLGFLK